MFISPCTLRSTQCAALIALAAAAGLMRMELPPHASPTDPGASSSLPHHLRATVPATGFYLAGAARSAWLHPWNTFALWLLRARTRHSTADVARLSPTTSLPASLAYSTLPATPPRVARLPGATTLPPRGDEPPFAHCTLPHLIPFASGPPAAATHSPHRAAGTIVPTDATARWNSVNPAVPFSVRFVARLACRSFPGHRLPGPSVSPRSARRGKPVLPPARSRCLPRLAVAGSRAAYLFSL